ncbi:MAG: hypothetical protein ACPG2Y_02370, partial [Acholeplasmataceae bacterium]
EYIQRHNLWDWHDWAKLNNQEMIYAGVIVDPHLPVPMVPVYYYVTNVRYEMPDKLCEMLTSKEQNRRINEWTWDKINKSHFIPNCVVSYQKLTYNQNINKWIISDETEEVCIDASFCWTTRSPIELVGTVVRLLPDGITYENIELDPPVLQHPDVQANKPFIFAICSFDKYHHTQFTGLHSMNTHGCYWWLGNIDPNFQFTNKYTMITAQAPGILPFVTILKHIYKEWQFLMQYGCLLPKKNGVMRVYGMISHHITDMQDKDVLMRRRHCSHSSRCDGMLWLGCEDGVKWPSNAPSLLELNTVMPGPYMLSVWKYIQQMDCNPSCYDKSLFPMTLTTATEDVFNELAIDTTLKSPPEINHTTLLGFLKDAFMIEYVKMHDKGGYDEMFTRIEMIAYLNKYWVDVNGRTAFLGDKNTNITVFNQIHHAYRKLIEIMISLPRVCNWDSGMNTLCNLIRMTGCLHICKSEKRRQELIPVMKNICDEGMLYPFLFFFM